MFKNRVQTSNFIKRHKVGFYNDAYAKYCYDFPVGSHKVNLTQQLINLLTL